MSGASLLIAALLQQPEILAIRCERFPDGVAVKILATSAIPNLDVVRSGETALVTVPATQPAKPLELPAVLAPLRSIALESAPAQTRVSVSWAPGATFESRVDGSMVTLLFRSQDQPPASRDVERLYPLLFPKSSPELALETPSGPAAAEAEAPQGGLAIGSFRLRPSFVARYADSSATFLDTPEPIAVRYLEIQPTLTVAAGSDADRARLSLTYEPRFRSSQQDIEALSEPTHMFTGVIDFPVGSNVRFVLLDRWHRATLEADVLDPGREYFYDLSRFQRNEITVGARMETPGRLDWDVDASRASEKITRGSGYFDNVREAVSFGPRYELGAASKLTLRYQFERVPPPPERPVAESRAHSIALGFDGEVATSLRATIAAVFLRERHPRALAPGDRFDGLTLSASVRREFLSGANLVLGAGRASHLSGFEGNAFYVANRLDATFVVPVPSGIWLSSGARWQRSDYRLRATGLTVPREDRLSGWSAGLSRSITRWSSLRADYHWDRRVSNIPGLATRTHSFVAQLGFGGLRPGVGR